MSAMIPERWRTIPGHEGRYEVSDHGHVRSLVSGSPRVLRQYLNTKRGGYLEVSLYLRGGRRSTERKVHQLVLAAFVGPLPAGQVVRHLNGNPTDNRLLNLAYGTQSENAFDTVRHGRNKQASATVCKSGHPLSAWNVRVTDGRRVCRECERSRSLAYVARQRQRPKSELDHGKIRSYIAGCRCDLCKAARKAAYQREKARRAA